MSGVLWGALGVNRLHRSGMSPQRILVVGSRSLVRTRAGRGAVTRLVEDLTDRIWLNSRRGLDVDVACELPHRLRAVSSALAALRLFRYDIVVLLSAHPDGRLRLRRTSIGHLVSTIRREMAPTARFLSVTLDEMPTPSAPPSWSTAPRSPRLDRAPITGPRATAAAIVRRLQMPPIEQGRGDVVTDRGDPARARIEAVESLGLRDRSDDGPLERLVERVCDAFDAQYAELNVVGDGEQWSLAATGLRRGTRSTEKSLCELAVQRSEATVICDTLREMPLHDVPRLGSGRLVRFYAGHPIHSIDGHRIGVLCVYDSRPHLVDDDLVSTLRDLALLAEERLVGA